MDEDKTERFFIVGIRRSGTSILRKIISTAPEVERILFEPHELYHSLMMLHFRRFKTESHQRAVNDFRPSDPEKLIGAKIALNPGIDALDWIWMTRVYPEAKFIFIRRNLQDSYASYYKTDLGSVRGIIPERAYSPMFTWLAGSMFDFYQNNRGRSVIINYDKMVQSPSAELKRAWELLGIPEPPGIETMIHPPENRKGMENHGIKYAEFGLNTKKETNEKNNSDVSDAKSA